MFILHIISDRRFLDFDNELENLRILNDTFKRLGSQSRL
jgi:hypothetical protein